jgi:hypothetical protein
VVDSEEDIV